jgi:hypothetical protein
LGKKKHVKKKQKQKKKPAATVNIPRVLEYSIMRTKVNIHCNYKKKVMRPNHHALSYESLCNRIITFSKF